MLSDLMLDKLKNKSLPEKSKIYPNIIKLFG
jgi:hypothetical protein